MTAATDWDRWHDPYADESSALSRRLRTVQERINECLDRTAPDPVTVVSCCAGDGRDLIQVLASRQDAARVRATLFELDPRNAARAESLATAAGLKSLAVRRVDTGVSDAYAGSVPADLLLLCGVFGNIADDDVHRLINAVRQLCAPGARVIWTRHRRAGPYADHPPLVRPGWVR